MQINFWVIPGIKRNNFVSDQTIIRFIINAVTEVTGYSFEDLLNTNRTRDRVLARNFCYYFIREYTRCSLNQIGDLFHKDHATIIYGIRIVNNLITTKDTVTLAWHKSIQSLLKQSI